MARIAQIVVTVSLSLWLGGLVALFVFVSALFKDDRTVAIQAAPVLFDVFAKFQIVLGVIGLIALFLWRGIVRLSWLNVITVLVALSLGSAAYVMFAIIPEMTRIRIAGQSSDSPRFRELHGRSMMVYSSQTIALLISAILLPGAIARTARESFPATGSPDAIADPVAVR